jgi:hypothetical protein
MVVQDGSKEVHFLLIVCGQFHDFLLAINAEPNEP